MSRKSKRKATQDKSSAARPSASVSSKKEKAGDRWPGIEQHQTSRNDRWKVLAVCLFLAVIVWVVYGQTVRFEFVNLDDNHYVYENPTVAAGLTFQGIASAFTKGESDNWVPLTTISHMVDCQLYGLNAWGHHLTNVLLHTASAILLFLLLRRMTGFLWRCAFVAAVFAVHPLHVESVAWVSERKDVLSGFFFMLTLWAYVSYVRRPASLVSYLMVMLFFALGLMAKPMLVTLPFVLLLLDYWPLNRFSNIQSAHRLKDFSIPKRLLFEKVPLLALSVASCLLTVLAQSRISAISSLDKLHFSMRIGNAVVSCVTYIWQMFYPVGLAPYYPYPINGLPFWKIIGAFVVLAAISWGAYLGPQKRSYLLVGWLWYLGMLVPVVGLIQVGNQALADRYTYLPQIGLSIMLVWLVVELSASRLNRRLVLSGFGSCLIIAMIFSARLQASYWNNSETLWRHTLSVTSNNSFAYNNLGFTLAQKGQEEQAIIEYQKSLAIDPGYAMAHNNLGDALAQIGQVDTAIDQFEKALSLDPKLSLAYNNLGQALAQKGQMDEAIVQFEKALALDPDFSLACNNLGYALAQKGQTEKAIAEYQKALAINPNYAQAYYNYGNALDQIGQPGEAIVQFQKALAIDPNFSTAHNNLGYVLLQKGQVDEAIVEYQKALVINSNNAEGCLGLGNALAQKGKVDEAIVQFQKALAIKPDFVEAYYNLGYVLLQKGRVDEGIVQFQKALALQPDFVAAQNMLDRIAWTMATSTDPSVRNGPKALELAQEKDRLTGGGNPMAASTVAAADAEMGKFSDAITNVQRAIQLASGQNDSSMVIALQVQLKCYKAGNPFRDSSTPLK